MPASLRRISSFARLDAFLFSFFFSSLLFFFRGIIKDKKGYSFYEVVVDAGLRKIINLRIDFFLKNWMVYLYDDWRIFLDLDVFDNRCKY